MTNGELFNLAVEYIIWYNFGNEELVILGRDMLIFFWGYLMSFVVGGIVEIFKKEKKK